MEGGCGRNTQELIIVGLNYSKEYFKKDIRKGFLMLKVVTDLDWLLKESVEYHCWRFSITRLDKYLFHKWSCPEGRADFDASWNIFPSEFFVGFCVLLWQQQWDGCTGYNLSAVAVATTCCRQPPASPTASAPAFTRASPAITEVCLLLKPEPWSRGILPQHYKVWNTTA